MTKNADQILPDKPLTDPDNDRLGYAPFAKHLAISISKMKTTEGLVLALNGPWGSGKTTITLFAVYYLKQLPKKNQPIILQFNPWWFSGDESLILHFFEQLRLTFEKEKVLGENLDKRLTQMLDVVYDFVPDLPWYLKIIYKLLPWRKKQSNVQDLKQSISESLRKQNKKILVIIDDIDRLTAEEIRQIFKLIKAVADFPNVIYLLSFDKKVVIEALKTVQQVSGEEYLEKIVQAPFDVPLPDKSSLRALFFEKLDLIFVDTPQKDFDSMRWQTIFFECLEKYILTPRSIVRLYNSLSVTYPAVKGQVNAVDFIAIEALRIFSPKAYDVIRLNPNEFTGDVQSSVYSGKEETEALNKFHKAWVESLDDAERKIIAKILPALFPKLRRVFGGVDSGSGNETNWRIEKRVCHPQVFPIYFSFAVSTNIVSPLEIEAIIGLTTDPKTFSKKLLNLFKEKLPDKTSRLRQVLGSLRDYAFEVIPKENIPNIIKAFCDVGDQLIVPEDEGLGMFEFDNEVLMGRVLWPLLKRQTKDENFAALKAAVSKGKSLSVIVSELATIGQQQGKLSNKADPEDEWFVSADQLSKLEKIALKKIRKAATDGTLLSVRKLPNILYRWRDWSQNKGEVRAWVKKIIRTDKSLVTFLTKLAGKTYSYGSSGVKIKLRLDPKWLADFLDMEKVIVRVKRLAKDKKLSVDQKAALDTLLKEYKLRKAGKDPDNPLSEL